MNCIAIKYIVKHKNLKLNSFFVKIKMERDFRFCFIKTTLITINCIGLLIAILSVIKGVAKLNNNEDDKSAISIIIVSGLIIGLSLTALFATYFEKSVILLMYGLCLLLSLFLTPLFWSSEFLRISLSPSVTTGSLVPIILVSLILLLMSLSISLSLKIRKTQSPYQTKFNQ